MTTAPPPAPNDLWDEVERNAWRPPDRLTPSEWAQRHRVLTRRQSSRPGPWDNANAPILKGFMDLCVRKGVRQVWALKAAQIGASEAVRNVLGYLAAQEPDPVLLVLPNNKDGRKIVAKRIIPLFEDTPCLAALSTGSTRDTKLESILLTNGFQLQLGTACSPSSLASDPFRVGIADETDKYPEFSGREASPIELIDVRTRTYKERALLIALSTPTTRAGPIFQGWSACTTKLWYYVPCPHCGAFQRLTFDRIRWEAFKDLPDDKARAARIRARSAAWYQCAKCDRRIEEAQKRPILLAGYWGPEDGSWKLFFDGREEGTFPEGDRFGLHMPAQYDLSTPFATIASDAVLAGKDPARLMHLRNSTLAEVFEQPISTPTVDVFSAKCQPDVDAGFTPAPAKVVPKWVSRLVMTVDTQKDHFWFTIRGWGYGYRSQRIHHGKVTSFAELDELFYRAYFPYEGNAYPPIRCHMLGIDSGGGKIGLDRSRTDEVYQYCLKDPLWIRPLKGASKPSDQPIRLRKVLYSPLNKSRNPYEVWLFLIDTGHFQDVLEGYTRNKTPVADPATGEVLEEDHWLLNDFNDPEYNAHLANMHKVRIGSCGLQEAWVPKTGGARVDLRDVEVYNVAMAHGPALCGALPSAEQMTRQLQLAQQAANRRPTGGITTPDGRPFLATQR